MVLHLEFEMLTNDVLLTIEITDVRRVMTRPLNGIMESVALVLTQAMRTVSGVAAGISMEGNSGEIDFLIAIASFQKTLHSRGFV